MAVQRLNPDGVPKPTGYSQCVRVGGLLFLAGQVPVDTRGNLVGRGDAEAQVGQVYRNLETVLKGAGATLQDVVKFTVFITHPDYAQHVRAARERLYAQNPPASTLVVVESLARPEFLVEIEAIAAVP